MGAYVIKIFFFSCGSSGEEHLSLNGTTKIWTSTLILTYIKIRLAKKKKVIIK